MTSTFSATAHAELLSSTPSSTHKPAFVPRKAALSENDLALLKAYEDSKTIFHTRKTIQEGDLVIVYISRDTLVPLIITPGETLHNKYGRYDHGEMIGCAFGSKFRGLSDGVRNPLGGYIHLLRPTPQLWTQALPHRTQIVYQPDIAYIMQELGVRPGSKVAEAGTGSGSMSHALAMAVGDPEVSGGKVFSFEYHATRYSKALKEFEAHGLADVITLAHRNVCKDGFGEEAKEVDSVFLDVPAPWEAVAHAAKILRTDISTKICCFSPCIEQVSRTVTALDAEGFSDIAMFEVLTRAHEIALPEPTFRTVTSISEKNRLHAENKEVHRKRQMMNARERNKKKAAAEEGAGRTGVAAGKLSVTPKDGMDQPEDEEEALMAQSMAQASGLKRANEEVVDTSEEQGQRPAKRSKAEGNVKEVDSPTSGIPAWLIVPITTASATQQSAAPALAESIEVDAEEEQAPQSEKITPAAPHNRKQRQSRGKQSDDGICKEEEESHSGTDAQHDGESEDGQEKDYGLPSVFRVFRPVAEMRGHTSYLTFATMIPKSVREEMEAWEEEKEGRKRIRAEAAAAASKGETMVARAEASTPMVEISSTGVSAVVPIEVETGGASVEVEAVGLPIEVETGGVAIEVDPEVSVTVEIEVPTADVDMDEEEEVAQASSSKSGCMVA